MKNNGIDWGEAVVPAIGLLFGVSFFLQTGDAPEDAMQWPYLTAAAASLLWVPIVFKFVRSRVTRPEKIPIERLWRNNRRVVFIFCAPVGYLLLMPYIGFTIANFFLLLIVFRGLGGKRWIRNISVAFVIALFLHLALVVFMQLSLPQLTIGPFAV